MTWWTYSTRRSVKDLVTLTRLPGGWAYIHVNNAGQGARLTQDELRQLRDQINEVIE